MPLAPPPQTFDAKVETSAIQAGKETSDAQEMTMEERLYQMEQENARLREEKEREIAILREEKEQEIAKLREENRILRAGTSVRESPHEE